MGDPGSSSSVQVAVIDPPQVSTQSLTVDVLGVATATATGTIAAVGPCVAPISYAILDADQPSTGFASINAATGAFEYGVRYAIDTHTSFIVTLTDTQPCGLAVVDVTLNADPLLRNQWHIQNNGLDAFSSNLPVFGNDGNVAPAWLAGYSGRGIKVGIVDTGLSYYEPDLSLNIDLGHSFNFLDGTNDATPATTVGFDNGTEVAGIVGAVAFNNSGGRGVAFNATLRGYNLLAPGAFSVANMTKSLGGDPISADNDLFVASFGPAPSTLQTTSGAYDAIRATSLSLRGGLGAAVVSPAGDDFDDWTYSPGSGRCADANRFAVSCGDPANDERLGGASAILVAATDADGKHSSYSDTGSAVWISAAGGEYGLNSTYTTGPNFDPGIITATRRGCVYYTSALNPLDSLGAHPLAPDCGYTATMHGTSAAAANVAGVIALMLEANPNLAVRDIKYILAKTARPLEPAFAGVSTAELVVGSSIVLEQGWTTNAAGMTFSNRYGFGGVDAGAAVEMAKSYVAYLPATQTSTRYAVLAAAPPDIPAQSVAGRSVVFAVAEPFTRVEAVQAFLNLASTPGIHCNQIELTSPSGTKSILLHAASGFSNTDLVDVSFVSNAFYGEPANGRWVLTYFDFCAASATPSTLSITSPQQLSITGH